MGSRSEGILVESTNLSQAKTFEQHEKLKTTEHAVSEFFTVVSYPNKPSQILGSWEEHQVLAIAYRNHLIELLA